MSRKLLTSTAWTSGMTLLSRIAGLVRDMVFASLIGAGTGVAADAFYVAFRIPNFLRRIFGEGAFSQAFVPVFADYKAKASQDEIRNFLNHMLGYLGAILLVVTIIGIAVAPVLVGMLAPGYLDEPQKYGLTVTMLRIIFPYIFFVSLVAMAAGILNTYGRFGAAAFTPVLLNLCLIGAAVWLAPQLDEPVLALAWGVFIAGLVQLAFQIPFLRQLKLLPWPRLKWRQQHEGVARVAKLMLPAIFGVSIAQVNLLVNTILASFLITGSVSWLYYADRFMEFPLGVFGIALATVILPGLSRRHANQSNEDFSHLLDWGMRWVVIIGVPASVALILLSGPLLATVFYRGAFTANDVQMTTSALIAFSFGLLGFMLIKVLAPGFYARQDTKTPVRIGVVTMGVNIVLSLALFYPFGHVGLASAISVAAFVNAGLLFYRLYRGGIYRPSSGWGLFAFRVLLASAVMGVVLYLGTADLASWLDARPRARVVQLVLWVGIGAVTYFVTALAVGLRPKQLLLTGAESSRHDD